MRRLVLMVVALLVGFTSFAHAQLVTQSVRFNGDVLWRPIVTEAHWNHRADLGLRYRVCHDIACLQVGGLFISENATQFDGQDAMTTHVAAGIEVTPVKQLTLSVDYGQFLTKSRFAPNDYYRFVAVGAEYRWKQLVVNAEQQVAQFDKAKFGPAIHGTRLMGTYRWVLVEADRIFGAKPNDYAIYTYRVRLTPWRIGPFVEAGAFAVPKMHAWRHPRQEAVRALALGFHWE
jgi:hypothetical protein